MKLKKVITQEQIDNTKLKSLKRSLYRAQKVQRLLKFFDNIPASESYGDPYKGQTYLEENKSEIIAEMPPKDAKGLSAEQQYDKMYNYIDVVLSMYSNRNEWLSSLKQTETKEKSF